ncbi:MAG TPA: ABC transporter ATP-binding protein [Myxococcota bacterium]|jgi:ABC-2 type transport system ATP-binding protein|nr:ABC transporter ATP-binding protein [Myxococcota bacterium]
MKSGVRDVVVVEALEKTFRAGLLGRKKKVLDGISFRVGDGEIFGFVGPNGAGKTTTLKVLMGLIRASAGRATILGHDVAESAFRRQIGFLPENPYFYEYLTGREILRFYARVSGVPRAEIDARATRLLEWVGLSHAADARLRTYSKGMLQRTGIAQALVHDPKVVFLDEPMSGLDPIGRKEIRDLVLRLRETGKTVFMNTHILSDVETVCDRVAIIVKGRIRYEGGTHDFLDEGECMSDLVLQAVPPALGERLEADRLVVRGRGDRIELRVRDKEVGELLQVALAAGARIVSVSPHRRSLEEIFLSAVAHQESASAAGMPR